MAITETEPATTPGQPAPANLPAVIAKPNPANAKKTSPWRLAMWAVVLVAASAIAWYFAAPLVLGPIVSPTEVIRADLVQTLVASGHVETPYRVTVSSQVLGAVTQIPVSEGDSVRVGDILVRLDDKDARASVAQAAAQVAQAEARVRQLRELTLPSAEQALAQSKATLLNAQKSYDRALQLARGGIVSRSALDEATKNRGVARAELEGAELKVFSNRAGGSDYVLVETQLEQARAGLAETQSRLANYTIPAPRDGILIARSVEVGNIVQPGAALMTLSPDGAARIALQIDEKNFGLLAVGQPALVSADAYEKLTFPATVDFINPAVDLERASVEVKLAVANPPEYLREDMTVSVDIEVARRPKTLIVDAADVHDLKGGSPWVLKVEGSHARRAAVAIGLVSAGKVEILSGISEGDRVISTSDASIVDGSRIRVGARPGSSP